MIKFCIKFTLLDIELPIRLRTERTEENITSISASFNGDHQLWIRHRSSVSQQRGKSCERI